MDNECLISMFRRGIKIKIIGDSLAAGAGESQENRTDEVIITTDRQVYKRRYGTNSWSALFEKYLKDKFPKCSVVNNGCGGITSAEVRDHLSELYSDDDDIIILMLGTNDRKVEDGMNILFENLTYLVRFFKKKGKKIIMMSITPSTVQNECYANRLYHNEDVNNIIECVAQNENVFLVNNFNYIQDYLLFTGKTIEDIMMQENCMNDGLHPTDFVQELIFRNLMQNIGLGVKVKGATW